MAGPLLRCLWSSSRRSISSSSYHHKSHLITKSSVFPNLLARAFSAATATSAAGVAPSSDLDPSRLRNVAVIAHVDHGKTTLMDRLLRQCGADIPHERAMDSISLERERGITIASKVTSVSWKDNELNMVDTPGHADFGGEVERVVGMVEGAILVVDAGEGPLAQTKFVLAKALKYGLRPLLLLNKVDRPSVTEERCNEVESWYSIYLQIWGLQLLDAIVRHVPPPAAKLDEPFQMLVSMMERDFYLGRILTGRIACGIIRTGDRVHGLRVKDSGVEKIEEGKFYEVILSIKRGSIDAGAGDIVSMAGLAHPSIGHTVANVELTGGKIGDRLMAEAETNLAINVLPGLSESYEVQGRGELQLGAHFGNFHSVKFLRLEA
ncbi:typA, partial [Cucurbita argyrosperma subsp. argyrosperma]